MLWLVWYPASLMRRFVQLLGAVAVSAILTACGQPGAPIAPSLELPRAAEGVSAARKGDKVTLRWTPPSRFSDGRLIRRLGPTNVCRSAGDTAALKCNSIAKVETKVENAARPEAKQYEDVLPDAILKQAPTGSVMYGVEVLNKYGRSVGISEQIRISTAPTLAPPAHLGATLADQGVTLAWEPVAAPVVESLGFAYQISRRTEGGAFQVIANVPITEAKFLDDGIEWEKKIEYRMAVLTHDAKQTLVEGDDSETISVLAHDVFPPTQPRELQAVFSGPGQQAFIDLSWAANQEADLAGYNVYRSEEDGAAVKVNQQVVTAPSFRDEHVSAGKTYVYSVSAVDVRGNESAKSEAASEKVP